MFSDNSKIKNIISQGEKNILSIKAPETSIFYIKNRIYNFEKEINSKK
jgi:hypothetical protein